MKTMDLNKTVKFGVSIIFTIFFTVLGVNAWAGLTASSGDKLDYQKWNELVNTVQSGRIPGEVVAFNLSSCPTGWTEYTAARGRTVIGVGNGAGSNESLGTTGGDKSKPAISSSISVSTAAATTATPTLTDGQTVYLMNSTSGLNLKGLYSLTAPTVGSIATIPVTISGGGTAPDNMQPYVALLYCVKN